MPTRLTLSYYPWITQSISGSALEKEIAEFVRLLQEQLRTQIGNDAEVVHLKEMQVPDQLKEIEAQPTAGVTGKIGLLNPFGFALLRHRARAAFGTDEEKWPVTTIAVILRQVPDEPIGPIYKAQFYTHRQTALSIKTLAQVRGRTLAFGSAQSTSNFLVPAHTLLKAAGIHPLTGFTRVEFTGGHDKAAAAVYERQLDIGVGHDGVIDDLANKPGYRDAREVLVRLAWTPPIPSDPVAAHIPDAGLRNEVAKAFVTIAPPGKPSYLGNPVVKRFWGTDAGFEPIDPKKYDELLVKCGDLKIDPEDMLKKA
jgi:hypothetical protein